jgi:capsular polysaccharide biosynthesis protein
MPRLKRETSILSEPFAVDREKPQNIKDDNLSLFEHEFSREFDQSNFYQIENAQIDSRGIIFSKGMISSHSLRHLRRKKAFTKFEKVRLYYNRLIDRTKSKRIDQAIWITDGWSKGYFHWFGDVLPILLLLKEKGVDGVIVIPSQVASMNYVAESLKALDVEFVTIDDDVLFKIKRLIVSDLIAPSGNFKPDLMLKLSSRIKKHYSVKDHPFRKIFISREHAKRRRLVNGLKFEQKLKERGFEIVQMEDLSFGSQVALMSEAKVVMGIHGAGLTNMIFMPRGSKVIEMRAEKDHHNNCYFALADALGLDYSYLLCEVHETENDHIGDFKANIEAIKTILL